MEVAAEYLTWLAAESAANKGAILVARTGDACVGFIAFWIQCETNIAETPNSNRFGYVSDVYVAHAQRRHGIAQALIAAAENHFRCLEVGRIRVATLAGNRPARGAYERSGYHEYEVVLEKDIGARG